MKNLKHILITVLGVALLMASSASAQRQRLSAHDTISGVVSGCRVIIVYGRPNIVKKGTTEVRKIWGGLVPFGKVWRTGADEATLMITEQPIVLGGTLTVPAGCYTLFTLPQEDGSCKLIVNKQIGQWGIDSHQNANRDEKNDVGTVDLKKDTLDKTVDEFTMNVGRDPDVTGGGLISLSWELTKYSVPFTVQKPQS
jgi:hypothetical protein